MSEPVSIDELKRKALFDEYGELDRQLTQFAPVASRHKAVREQIQALVADLPAEKSATYRGALYEIRVSERAEERVFGIPAKRSVWKLLKTAKAWQHFSITLKSAEAELGKEVVAGLVSKTRTGSRKVTAVALAPAEAGQIAA